jgi:hypothetical protein
VANYIYDLTSFPNAQADPARLTDEIEADATIVTALEDQIGITVTAADCTIPFVAQLSGPEVTALDALIAAHPGTPYSVPDKFKSSIDAESTRDTSYKTKLIMNTNDIGAGKIEVDWYCEIKADDADGKVVVWRGSTDIGEVEAPNQWRQFCGHVVLQVPAGDHAWRIRYKHDTGADDMWIRNAWLHVRRRLEATIET